jgi:DNA-binding Xre family transcriptional regulator
MKQTELSRLSGISYQAINDLYHERTEAITFQIMEKLCQTLKVTPGDLLVVGEEQASGRR